MIHLTHLVVTNVGVERLGLFGRLTNLTVLVASHNPQLTSVTDLGLPHLSHMDIAGCDQLTNVHGLDELPALRVLSLVGCSSLGDISGIKRHQTLTTLVFSVCSLFAKGPADRLAHIPNLRLMRCSRDRISVLEAMVQKDTQALCWTTLAGQPWPTLATGWRCGNYQAAYLDALDFPAVVDNRRIFGKAHDKSMVMNGAPAGKLRWSSCRCKDLDDDNEDDDDDDDDDDRDLRPYLVRIEEYVPDFS